MSSDGSTISPPKNQILTIRKFNKLKTSKKFPKLPKFPKFPKFPDLVDRAFPKHKGELSGNFGNFQFFGNCGNPESEGREFFGFF